MSREFMKITNKDIYDELKLFMNKNDDQHDIIIKKQVETNGKVKLNRWIATTALTLILMVIAAYLSGKAFL